MLEGIRSKLVPGLYSQPIECFFKKHDSFPIVIHKKREISKYLWIFVRIFNEQHKNADSSFYRKIFD